MVEKEQVYFCSLQFQQLERLSSFCDMPVSSLNRQCTANAQNDDLKVLGKSVGLCKTTKRKGQLYISLLVSVWRIICDNFNPNGLILALRYEWKYKQRNKRILVLEKRYSNAHTIIIDSFLQWLFLSKMLQYLDFCDTIWQFFYHFTS